jgi:NodT family efflux transporter outer membrane factor (OMF) lipoprotein
MSSALRPLSKWMALSATALMAGCATPPDLGPRPKIATPAAYASALSFEAPQAAWPADGWWRAYGDPQLDALVEEALAGSPKLAAAAARVRQAEAAAQQSRSTLYPNVSASGSVQGMRREISGLNVPAGFSGASDKWTAQSQASLRIDYQLDLFGKNRAALAAATSMARAAQVEEASARLQLSSAVALAYADLVRYAVDRAAAQDNVRTRSETADLVRQKVAAGLENESQGHQAEAELSRARTDLAAAEGAVARTRNAIAALVGKGPDRGLEIAIPTNPRIAALALPADAGLELIGRRPDLVATRLRAEAAAKNIDVAKADFYPNVNLSALIGLQSLSLGGLASGTMGFAQAGPAISLPIFSAGRIEGQYRQSRAEYDEAAALYDQALADALKEVADALVNRRALEAQLVDARAALKSSEAAYRLARTRYQGGLASYIDTLSIETGLTAQRRTVAELEARAFALDITLVRALGGGFHAA